MAAINPGEFNTPCTLQALQSSPDGGGGTVATWQDVHLFFAKVKPLTGYRSLQYSGIITGNPYEITTHLLEINANNRIKLHSGQLLAIHSAVNEGLRNEFTIMICNDGK
jgi:SPP1 family predicted phage head-tail adaptor